VTDLTQQLGQLCTQRITNRGEKLAGGFFLAALDLREVTERDICRSGNFPQRAVLRLTAAPQCVTDHSTQQDHRFTSTLDVTETATCAVLFRQRNRPVSCSPRYPVEASADSTDFPR
jgi:hypothetical protein